MSAATAETLVGAGRTRGGSWARSLLRGRADDPVWVRPALIGLLGLTAFLYLVDLASSGYANGFYSAAVEAGSKSWKAFFFGSFDSSNFITVDKPPASLWVMDLSARIFGVSAWSILVPQALEGLAAVALLYSTVRRRFTPGAGLLAGAVLAVTPVAALMFRFNNPDAFLTLLLVAAAGALTRALERGGTRWLLLAGGLVGFGFLAKMLQAFLVVPGFAAVYLFAAPVSVWRRIVQLLASGIALFAAAAWWVAIVAVWPAGSRPYIGGSQDNSILNLIFGYNGFGRITGNEAGSVVGGRAGNGGAGMWGPTGITRLFGSEMGTQISWLLPAALVSLVALLWWTRRAARTDGRRAAVLIWGSWLVVTGTVFSFAQGIIHPYYTVVLAPAIGALVGIGVATTWARGRDIFARLVLATVVAGSGIWAFVLLDRTPTWHPGLRYAVLVLAIGAAGLVTVVGSGRGRSAVLGVAIAALLAAPLAYSAQTVSTGHSGALPSAGPAGSVGAQGPGGRGQGRFVQGGAAFGGPGGGAPPSFQGGGSPPPGAFPRSGSIPGAGSGSSSGLGPTGQIGRFGGQGQSGALGGLLDSGTPSKELVSLLEKNASSYRWVAATVGANSAAGVQLATGEPVMAIGGFNGTDPWPTLTAFEANVAAGKIHYFLAGGSGGPGGAGSSGSTTSIASWVAGHFTAKTVGGITVYDLTQAASA